MTKLNPNTIWHDFQTAFCSALDEFDRVALLQAWQKYYRTPFYEHELMPAIKGKLGLDLKAERFRCDYTFLDANRIPHIFAESENDHKTAAHEIEALCCFAAPLKVLFLSCAWQATEREKFLPGWCEIIRKHHAAVPLDCLYAIIVGEWDDEPDDARLNYFFYLGKH
jgi:hypothetical protein